MTLNAVTPFSERAYGSNALRSARDTEYDVFSRVTRLLREASRDGRGRDTIFAVYKNNELWTILATDLSDPANALPREVKAGLISLAIFSLRHGKTVLAGDATIDALIEVNIAVMKGLRGEAAK